MNKTFRFCLYLIFAIFLTNCVNERQYNFSLKDTLAIFFINDEKKNYFCIPVQYIGDYYISDFKFTEGFVCIGDYEIKLNRDEVKNIINEYKKGNVNSKMYVGYDIVIDNEEQKGSGMLDDFELYDGVAFDPSFFPVNLNFFKKKYL